MRPKIKFLTKGNIEKIYSNALELLEQTGIAVKNTQALDVFKNSSAEVDSKGDLVKIPPHVVEEALKKTPKSVTLYDRNGKESMKLEKNNVHFDPGSAAINFLDRSGNARKPVSKDLEDFAKLVDGLEHIHAQSTALVVSDVLEEIADRYRLYIILKNSTKAIITGSFSIDGFIDMKDMLAAVRGGEKDLARKPLAIFDVCPSPPLSWSKISAQNIIDGARFNIPMEIISMPLEGGTGPVTVAGSLVQHTAESLSGLVLAQLTNPGAPVIYGGSPAALDMRYGTTPMAAIETIMTDCAYAEIGKYFGLPTHAYLGLSDSKIFDQQAGLESAMGLVLGSMAGINVISGPGMLEFEKCQSMEKLVMDNELCGMCLRLIDGIGVSEDALALDLLKEIGPGGNFLSSRHTLEWFKKEQFIPSKIIDRCPRKLWTESGSKDALARARKMVEELLTSSNPEPLENGLLAMLDEVVKRFARTYKVSRLPIGPEI